jgi:hypothetical protein
MKAGKVFNLKELSIKVLIPFDLEGKVSREYVLIVTSGWA